MKTYLISLFIIVVLISVVQIILPKGKITSAATCVLSFAMALCFINALGGISFDFIGFNFKGETTEKSTSVFNEYVDSKLENYYESAFISLLKDNDLICEKVNVEICNKEIEKTERESWHQCRSRCCGFPPANPDRPAPMPHGLQGHP